MNTILDGAALQKYLDITPWLQSPPPSIPPPPMLSEGGRRSQRMVDRERRKIFPFFRLPRELRDIVYDFTLSDHAFEFYHVNMKFRASYNPISAQECFKVSLEDDMTTRKVVRWPPRCVLLSKQFFSEALAQLHHMAWFMPHAEPDTPRAAARPVGSLRVDHARHVSLLAILKSGSSRHMIVTPICDLRDERRMFWYTDVISPHRPHFTQTIHHLSRSTTLKIIILHIDFISGLLKDGAELSGVSEQFLPSPMVSLLHGLPKLELIAVSMACPPVIWEVPRWQGAFARTYEELTLVAKHLISEPRAKTWEWHDSIAGMVVLRYQVASAVQLRRRKLKGPVHRGRHEKIPRH